MKSIIMRLFRKEYIISYNYDGGNGRLLMGFDSILGIKRKDIKDIEKYVVDTYKLKNVLINNIQRIKWYGL